MFNAESIKALVIAGVVVAAGLFFLAWQYKAIEERRLPHIEQELQEQKQAAERQDARNTVDSFMRARQEGNQEQAMRWLTERAAQQNAEEQFQLIGDVQAFEIQQSEQLEENRFRFQVSVRTSQGFPRLELLEAEKILEQYYIDSVQIAG
ncbi:MAG: hypothetical protein Q8P39_03920 [Candidatus Yanofskybacteria bacterium]|nr:hypothetical protein [Candidatus Yanofskybacteria bacterium]